ncbi:tetratricopeptide repeat protein [Mucilaginibacter paludis]|uniref:Tetratricopeptide TPR_1 repeat-containing protein n=1 Tax=Mucilaginibacter paludis DSM 18603 TaxID=714943 RepID=H1YFU4_9SPHI|nr:hypothetical protein [Mucilaginibacter paludis]EHQ25335.1 Tetratricopeptide TPR_1 repeat-containing protein [Mucilaginibacter paludis DSM 18603]
MKLFIPLAAASALSVISLSNTFAQSLTEAQTAIDAEQYQKAKMLLTKLTQGAKPTDEDCFYLGWVYLQQDYPDSAKMAFNKGLGINPKSALNYIGLGAAAKADNDAANLQANFTKALPLTGKNDKPYIFMAKTYLSEPKPDADAALATLEKAAAFGTKDPEYFMTLGDAYRGKADNNHAYLNYAQAQSLDAKAAGTYVAIGILWKQAHNFEDATQKFKDALTINPNYGPAYRGLAETDLLWAKMDPKMASAKVKEGADYYKKYLDFTDQSAESKMRYADFLIQAGDYKALEQVANQLAQSSKSNLRIYRYLAYSAFENKNYPAGLEAINKFMKEAEAKRIIPRDYLYLGRLQLNNNLDSLGIISLKKALELDSTNTEVYAEIARVYYTKQKYVQAGDAYQKYIASSKQPKLGDYFREGMSYYFGYSDQYYNSGQKPGAARPDSTLLTKADSAFSYVQQKTSSKPYPDVFLYRARLKDMEEPNRNNLQGFAKPFYEQYITLATATPAADERVKKNIAEAYAYLGSYFEFKEKDDAKAAENFAKAKDAYADNKQAKAYFERKETASVKGK